MTFLVADGVTPSNEGRGYVLRRIIRRAVQQAFGSGGRRSSPGSPDVVIEQMGGAYPELAEHRDQIHRVLTAEEERFSRDARARDAALRGGCAGGDVSARTRSAARHVRVPARADAELARERGLAVDEEEFPRLMEEQRERSRAGRRATVARGRPRGRTSDRVRRLREDRGPDGGRRARGARGRPFLAKLYESPFYPEGGGQVTTSGWIEHEETGARAEPREAYRWATTRC